MQYGGSIERHIGDRENDIFEFFCAAREIGTHFVVRTCVNRLAGDGKHTIADEMTEVEVQGLHSVITGLGASDNVELELKYKQIRVLPPIGKQKRYPVQHRNRPVILSITHKSQISFLSCPV